MIGRTAAAVGECLGIKFKGALIKMSRKEKYYIVFLYCIVYLFYLLEKIKDM